MRIRLVQVGVVFERMQFVVRDLAREFDKDIRLHLVGGETEIDKLIVERIMDPLLHLVRNAISHGIETRAERQQAGKPPVATITLSAATVGDTVHIEVEDDGRGIDVDRVTARARELELIGPHDELDMLSLVDVICMPGFSTQEQVDRASGRGIGMAVVKNVVQELGGTIALETQRGRGTCFTLELPLTLAIMDALVVRVGSQTLAVPLPAVREVMELSPDAITHMENNEIMSYRGGVLPLIRLAQLFRISDSTARRWHALVVGSGQHAIGIVVDRIVAQREIVVHALADPLVQVPGISGATELGDGRVVLIADTAALARLAQRSRAEPVIRRDGSSGRPE
jgi:two-component system chemotaxis sensor kinase CheA